MLSHYTYIWCVLHMSWLEKPEGKINVQDTLEENQERGTWLAQ